MAPSRSTATSKRSRPGRTHKEPNETQQSSSSLEASQSQELDAVSIERVLEQGKSAHHKWRVQRETIILKSRRERVARLRKAVTGVYKEHESKIRDLRKAKVQYLLSLIKRKRELEAKMEATRAELETQIRGVLSQVGEVFGQRKLAVVIEGD